MIFGQFIQLNVLQDMHALLNQQVMVNRLQVFQNKQRATRVKSIDAGPVIADDDSAVLFVGSSSHFPVSYQLTLLSI
ncbi:hypothetical protein HMP0721_1002 [Pseudoramibacter alactolyticus ATCC 23263]|uniref:Uncharacterized protein n=1 Tax=Pseudoramibacter alactolyticus ATCC 23263 TaxID=887929 RepID=E6MG69_9FIRM|nr:hypothetical protein HMP0721_1002 [Pseudoramibacter alactolyticus ATCC 23263]